MSDIIPKIALDFIKNKKLQTSFSYKDVWNEEHATSFTVAKAMQLDVLSDFHTAVTKAVENGQSFETFKKDIKPILQQKGWWGRKDMVDPKTGETVNAQLGSDRRLKTIYDTNMRQAYNEQQYQSAMESDSHPYLMYLLGSSIHHRPTHESWNGLILLKDDPWWDNHRPQREYFCRCKIRAVTEERKKRYEERGGIPIPPSKGGGTIPIKTEAPPEVYRTYYNERKGIIEKIPEGVQPGFNNNLKNIDRKSLLFDILIQKAEKKYPEEVENIANTFLSSNSNKTSFNNFIDKALKGKHGTACSSPVGFLNNKIMQFLKSKKINFHGSRIITLKTSFIKGIINAHDNKLIKENWYKILDYLKYSSIFWDSKNNKIVYLSINDNNHYLKMSVSLSANMDNPSINEISRFDFPNNNTVDQTKLKQISEMEVIR